MNIPRTLSPTMNPTGYLAAAGAVFAAVVMLVNAFNHHGVIDTGVIVAAIGAVGALLARQAVTPVADPKNGAGVPLVPAGTLTSLAPGQYTQTTAPPAAPSP